LSDENERVAKAAEQNIAQNHAQTQNISNQKESMEQMSQVVAELNNNSQPHMKL
jgi:uncharacterized protein YhaN